MRVYLIFEIGPFEHPYTLMKVFKNLMDALKYRNLKNQETEDDREYDEFGIIEGVEYVMVCKDVE